jgi:polysaccharide export outer membrane protein
MRRVILVGVVALVAGCSGGTSANWLKNGLLDPSQVGNFEKSVSNEIRGSISILEEPEGIQSAEEPTAEDVQPRFNERRIGPGDIVNVTIFELLTPGVATSVQLRIGNSPFETYPVIGQMRTSGLTARELELGLKEKIREAGVLDDADVQVTVVASPSDQFAVVGFIARPNTYPLPRPDYRLLEALAAAGGVPQYAEKLYVFRSEPRGSMTGRPPSASPMPRSEPEIEQPVPTPYTMSETSGARSGFAGGGRQDEPPSTTAAEETINEADILEGTPSSGPEIMPRWDAELGEWVLEGPADKPVASAPKARAAAATIQPEKTAPAAEETEPISGAATTTSEAGEPAQEGHVWEEAGGELEVPLRIIEIPVKELLDGDPRYNIFIRPGDTVNVPEGFVGEYYLGGNVVRAGAYNLTGRRITVKQAIVSAGGFGALAWPARAEVVRRVGKDEEQIIQLDLDAIFAGTAPDFYVKPNDIVNVGTTAVAPFMAVLRNAFRFSYGMGFVYDRNFADSDSFGAKEQVKTRHFQQALQRGLPSY